MPFTAAHPAAVLPLRRFFRRTPGFAALVVGSLTPDIAYFLPGISGRLDSHSPAGVFYFCLPVGLLLLWLFEQFLKQPLIAILPPGMQRPVTRFYAPIPVLRTAGIIMILLAIISGAFTHIIWDAFTHINSRLVRETEFLKMILLEFNGLQLRMYKLLQHLSTFIGGLLLLIAAGRWMGRQQNAATHTAIPALPLRPALLRIMLLLIPLTAGIIGGWLGSGPLDHFDAIRLFVRYMVITGVQAGVVALLLIGIYLRLR